MNLIEEVARLQQEKYMRENRRVKIFSNEFRYPKKE